MASVPVPQPISRTASPDEPQHLFPKGAFPPESDQPQEKIVAGGLMQNEPGRAGFFNLLDDLRHGYLLDFRTEVLK
jgi:hypothetical protein